VDLSEIARASVLQSSFPASKKREWLGENYHLPGVEGNGRFESRCIGSLCGWPMANLLTIETIEPSA